MNRIKIQINQKKKKKPRQLTISLPEKREGNSTAYILDQQHDKKNT